MRTIFSNEKICVIEDEGEIFIVNKANDNTTIKILSQGNDLVLSCLNKGTFVPSDYNGFGEIRVIPQP
jgi:hypothetical protein